MDKKFKKEVEKAYSTHINKPNYLNLINNHLDISRFEPWVAEINSLKNIRDSIVLSSGCGSGGDLYHFLQYKPKFVYGIEVRSELANLAKLRLNKIYSNFQIDTYEGESLPYKADTFDIIFSMHVLEHVKNPLHYLKELHRVLKPNGLIFLELPSKYYPIEQHTQIKYIHWLTNLFNNKVLNWVKKRTKGKLDRYVDITILWPHQILSYVNSLPNSKIIQSVLHSYDNKNMNFSLTSLLNPTIFNKTTYRIVISKTQK